MMSVANPVDPAEGAPATGAVEPISIESAVRDALDKTGHTWLRRVVVATEGACVVLRGTVPSYYLKQMAQTSILAISGMTALRNELRVEGGNR
jgi:osmotically-inducible protein OsmY